MPLPPTLTSYLPVLLVSVSHNAAPDDSSFDTQPQGQVDYLSHDWKEEDVWRSWRSMTRQKNAIANGMRLENASWRTWWKQRNKLKTISPETLNWLKDSDVTWLYGPLHIGHDWTDYSQRKNPKLHPGQRKTSTDALPGPYLTHPNSVPVPKKPILKHRSISQLLSLPASPFFNPTESDEEEEDVAEHVQDVFANPPLSRPPLVHTKSDTHISIRGRPFRKNSPPRIIAADNNKLASVCTPSRSSQTPSSDASASTSSDKTSSDQDLTDHLGTGPDGPKKKHISFNTYVEQCIAIEKPKTKRPTPTLAHGGRMFDSYDDGYDSDLGCDGGYDEPSFHYFHDSVVIGSDSDDDEDDVLEIRTASSRSRSNSLSLIRKSSLAAALTPDTNGRPRPPMVRRPSTDREHVTIAPIAPTMLKSTGVGNELATLPEGNTLASPKDVDLVYVPTAGHYSIPGTPNIGYEDVYHHKESYFSVGTSTPYPRSPASRSPAPGSSPQFASANMPAEHLLDVPRRTGSATFFPQSMTDSPMQFDDVPLDDAPFDDAYDYFEGPDLGEDFSHGQPQGPRRRHRKDVRDDDMRRDEIIPYSEGGASSVTTGRSNHSRRDRATLSPSPVESPRTADTDMPVVVVNEVNGAVEERQERSCESSPSHSPVPCRLPEQQSPSPPPNGSLPRTETEADAVLVPHICSTHPRAMHSSPSPSRSPPSSSSSSSVRTPAPASGTCSDPAALLSPPSDVLPPRGRMPYTPSVGGSTTTTPSSYRSSESRSDSRGRSSTRTSSFSDRERSNSRSGSRGANSPLGSISPTGSAIGIGYVRCRDRERGREVAGVRRRVVGGSDEDFIHCVHEPPGCVIDML